MPESQEDDELASDVSFTTGQITEDDLGLSAADIQQLVVAPTDWTIGVLVDLLKKKKIDLQPNYQRRIAWNETRMSRFMESLFMRLPVPQIVLAEMKPGVFSVIDGKQRMNSLARFCLDEVNPLRLDQCEYRPDLNNKTYLEMQVDQQHEASVDGFQNHTIRTVVLKNWKSDNLLYLLFLRLNQNSVTLSPQELRRALHPGKFMNWLDDKTSVSPGMEVIFRKIPDFRMRDMEIATRYLSFRKFASVYEGNMKKFLDDSSKFYKENFDTHEADLTNAWNDFEEGIKLTKKVFGVDAFRSRMQEKYQRTFNRAVLDIMVFYFSFAGVRQATTDDVHQAVKDAFEDLCDNNIQFSQAIQTSTKSVRATSQRFHAWGDKLRAIVGNAVPEFPLARTPE